MLKESYVCLNTSFLETDNFNRIIQTTTFISTIKKKLILKTGNNGVCINKENLVKISDYFFTIKPSGEGTGSGLSIHESVNEFDGKIDTKSIPGKTIFMVLFL
jgi:nitrogen-specific signal transduction histidine kinase